jgi:hypothetical protein
VKFRKVKVAVLQGAAREDGVGARIEPDSIKEKFDADLDKMSADFRRVNNDCPRIEKIDGNSETFSNNYESFQAILVTLYLMFLAGGARGGHCSSKAFDDSANILQFALIDFYLMLLARNTGDDEPTMLQALVFALYLMLAANLEADPDDSNADIPASNRDPGTSFVMFIGALPADARDPKAASAEHDPGTLYATAFALYVMLVALMHARANPRDPLQRMASELAKSNQKAGRLKEPPRIVTGDIENEVDGPRDRNDLVREQEQKKKREKQREREKALREREREQKKRREAERAKELLKQIEEETRRAERAKELLEQKEDKLEWEAVIVDPEAVQRLLIIWGFLDMADDEGQGKTLEDIFKDAEDLGNDPV